MSERSKRSGLRPPYERGNVAAVKSGAYSERAVRERAEALRPSLAGPLAECAWIDDADGAEVEDWLVREALVRLLTEELAARVAEHDGRLRDRDRWLFERIGGAQNRAQACRDRLLLNPLHRFRAGRDVAASEADLAALRATGAALVTDADATP